MKKFIIMGVVLVALAGLIVLGLSLNPSANKVSTSESTQPMAAGATSDKLAADAVVLDVRTEAEFAQTHARNAVNLPLQSLEAGTMPSADKNQLIYVYCRSGNRSTEAKAILEKAGYTQVRNLGGLDDARQAGLEFTNS